MILGVQPWQRDVIAAAMLRLNASVPFLSRLSDKELKSLHDRLGGFLSEESLRPLNWLADTTGCGPQKELRFENQPDTGNRQRC
jgi:hypothetical protein